MQLIAYPGDKIQVPYETDTDMYVVLAQQIDTKKYPDGKPVGVQTVSCDGTTSLR